MLIKNITESTMVNLTLLSNIADIILNHLPDTLKKDEEIIINGHELVDEIKPILKNYEDSKYKSSIIKVVSTDYRISNKSEYMFKTQGYYAATKSIIGINISGILNNSYDITKEKIKQIKSIKAVLVHELRHLFQYSEYPDFYKKDLSVDMSGLENIPKDKINDTLMQRKKEKYKKMKIEIDAVWHHLLSQYEDDGLDMKKFIGRIIDRLTYYKELTPKEKDHYTKKTARYYYDKGTEQ